MNVSLVNALANAMLRDYREVETSAHHPLNRSDAACVIDCVLSLNRDYDRFVLPRVMRFVQEHPGVTSVEELQFMMRTCASPHEFVQQHLGYNHAKRAEILMAVVDYLTTVGDLREWARSADPGGYRQVRVDGFGVAGWQYLRVLFGANTVKPDIHIKRYVERVTGKPIGATVKLVRLFEEASRRAGLRALDASISTVRYGAKARGVFSPPRDIKHSVRRHPK